MTREFSTLTKGELAALTEEKIQRYVDLACAEQGIPLLPDEPEALVTRTEPSPDVPLYKFGDWYFTNHDDAQALLDALFEKESIVKYDYKAASRYVVSAESPLAGWNPPKIERLQAYSPKEYAKAVPIFEENDRARNEHKEAQKQYDEIAEQRGKVEDEINEAISEARAWERRRAYLRTQYERYTELAGGDHKIAKRFFTNAYPGEKVPDEEDEYAAYEEASAAVDEPADV